MTIKVLIADDHRIVRDGLCALLEKETGMRVVAEAENGRTAVELARSKRPDVVIMDITMPELNGIEATRQITANWPEVKVLVLTVHSDRRAVADMLQAGASGFLTKECASEELVGAIRTVVAGQIYLPTDIAGAFVRELVRHGHSPTESSASSVLTAKEREILQLIAEGNSSREIATRLQVSIKTVDTHRRRMMEKLEVRSIAELTKYAVREGLTTLQS